MKWLKYMYAANEHIELMIEEFEANYVYKIYSRE